MSTINNLLRKASFILKFGSQDSYVQNTISDGEIIYCKNNVCVHPPAVIRTQVIHRPGYLTIRQQTDEILGSTLILSWTPNATLEKNPKSLQNRTPGSSPCQSTRSSSCPSPCPSVKLSLHLPLSHCNSPSLSHEKFIDEDGRLKPQSHPSDRSISSTMSDMGSPREDFSSQDSFTSDQNEFTPSTSSQQFSAEANDFENYEPVTVDVSVDLSEDKVKEPDAVNVNLQSQTDSGIGPEEVIAALEKMICGLDNIDNSNAEFAANQCNHMADDIFPIKQDIADGTQSSNNALKEITKKCCDQDKQKGTKPEFDLNISESVNDKQENVISSSTPGISVSCYSSAKTSSSSTTPTTSNKDPESFPSSPDESLPPSPISHQSLKFHFVEGTAESLAHAHNLSFPDDAPKSSSKVSRRESTGGFFSVDLSQMRSMRLFYSNKECTCGQLVIASRESQYKILHFHHGGLEKLAKVFEEYNFLLKSKSTGNENCPYRQFLVCRPVLSAGECHPEEGIYSLVNEEIWRKFMNEEGTIEDELQFRKEIFFGGLDSKLRKEVWPFLLHHYSFRSTFEKREQVRNDKYLEYQRIRRKRHQMSPEEQDVFWRNIQCTVEKDVVRTDRSHPFFDGEDNPNIEIMKNILLNYGFNDPHIGYTQGMSDLLAPILAAVQDEAEAFWCFVGLMQRTIFVTCPKDFDMDINLNYLRELFRVMNNKFYHHLCATDSLDLLFVHRWILLCFKREFPEAEAMKMWEACWAHYQTDYFYLFICSAIISIYGDDVIAQNLKADEMMVHFSSLAMHMNGELVLRKARGLLHQFRLLPRIPCTLAKLCELCGPGMWDSGHMPLIDCVGNHGDRACPHGGQDPAFKTAYNES